MGVYPLQAVPFNVQSNMELGREVQLNVHPELGPHERHELGLPIPEGGLTYAEASYEVRKSGGGVFPGFRCADCRFSQTPDLEDGYCLKIQRPINNLRGCCAFYEATRPAEISFTAQSGDAADTLLTLERGIFKHIPVLSREEQQKFLVALNEAFEKALTYRSPAPDLLGEAIAATTPLPLAPKEAKTTQLSEEALKALLPLL